MIIGEVWAPHAESVELIVDGKSWPVRRDGVWWRPEVELPAGARYGVRLDGRSELLADPRSRWQPDGVEALSRVPHREPYQWVHRDVQLTPWRDAVIYELHVGSFSAAGTFQGARDHLGHLADLGVTHVELMPIAAFGGRFGWGYDGACLWATHEPYGSPGDLRDLIDDCHGHGLAVLVDVVLNHLGPVGNRLREFGPYFTDRYSTPWGEGFNVDGADSDEVREHLLGSALAWLEDYRADGLRVDAADAIIDTSAIHLLEELRTRVDELAERLGRPLTLVAEWDRNDPRIVTPTTLGGNGFDAQWADELHHCLHATLTGETQGYYCDFDGGPAQIADALTRHYVLRGQYSRHRRRRHGRDPGALGGEHFVVCSQNHDQIGNRAAGRRLHELAGPLGALVAATLVACGPSIPLIFQGQEWQASTPFPYFADHGGTLGEQVRAGRRREFEAFGWEPEDVLDPIDPGTFERARLRWDERSEAEHREALEWFMMLLSLRRSRPELRAGAPCAARADDDLLIMDRGAIQICANFATTRRSTPSGRVLAATAGVAEHGDVVRLDPGHVVILEHAV